MEKTHATKCKSNEYLDPQFIKEKCDCDGYHTFDELYDHRITLFIALCRQLAGDSNGRGYVWRSKLHHDGSSLEGWYILGIFKEPGMQITYHLPLSRWGEAEFAKTLDRGPEWDGHTPDDVIERLKALS